MGLSFKFLNYLRTLYKCTLNCVWDGCNLSSWFETLSGVKQGCVLSPLLFALFLNDINDFVGGGLDIDRTVINILLYADDIVLISEDRKGLQQMIDKLKEYCDLWNLEVNMGKSQIVIMRNGGGPIAQSDNFNFGDQVIKAVKKYKYVGIELTPTLNLEQHFKTKITTTKFIMNDC